MTRDAQRVLSQNITIVYDSLDIKGIDTQQLKEVRPNGLNPVVMDTPELIVAMLPPEPLTIIQIGDRRVRVTVGQDAAEIGEIAIWEIAYKCHQLISSEKSSAIAYGFNYDVLSILEAADAQKALDSLFVRDINDLQERLQGQLVAVVPRILYMRDGILCDLLLERVEDERMKVHLNSHFSLEGRDFPSPTELKDSFFEQYGYLKTVSIKLFEKVVQ